MLIGMGLLKAIVNLVERVTNMNVKIIYLIVSLFSASLVVAQSCFLYPESPYYCTDISLELAQQECSSNGCVLEEMYISVSCSSLTNCQKIFCRSSCREDFSGLCPAGPVKDQTECSPGCCTYSSSEGPFCSYALNKWSCEIEAQNNQVNGSQFESDMAESECFSQCSSTMASVAKIPPKNISFLNVNTASPSSSWPWVLIFILLFSAAIIYLLFKYKLIHFPTSPSSSLKPTKLLSAFKYNPFAQIRLQHLQVQHQHQQKHRERERFLTEEQLLPEKKDPNFNRLQQVAKAYEHKKHPHPPRKRPEPKPPFERLKEISQK